MSQLLQFVWVEAEKRANNQVGTVLLDTLYMNEDLEGSFPILWKLQYNIVDSSNLGVHVDVVLGHLGHLPHLLRTLAAEHRHLAHHM